VSSLKKIENFFSFWKGRENLNWYLLVASYTRLENRRQITHDGIGEITVVNNSK
jgi:hypothetical protein